MESTPPKERTLDDLYADIPRVPCVKGCRDCCGVIPMASRREADQFEPGVVVDKVTKPNGERAGSRYLAPTLAGSATCVRVGDNEARHGCTIHDKRPFMCRLFGTVKASDVPYNHPAKHLICPHGRKPDKPLTPMQAMSLMHEYFEICAREEKATTEVAE